MFLFVTSELDFTAVLFLTFNKKWSDRTVKSYWIGRIHRLGCTLSQYVLGLFGDPANGVTNLIETTPRSDGAFGGEIPEQTLSYGFILVKCS